MGLIDRIKEDAKKSGQNKGKFIYFREGQKVRLRFLQDMDEGMEVKFHDSFSRNINVPCQEMFGRKCKYCDDETLRTRSQYVWSVYNYEANEVQLFMFPSNSYSPIPALIAMEDTYGTITDRDYVITCNGKQTNKTYSVVPMDKNKFRNDKAKPFSEKAILKMIDKAWPDENSSDDDDEDEDDEEEEKKPIKKSKQSKKKDDEEDDWDEEVEDDEEVDYDSMSAVELYKLCKERKIDAKIKKPERYYINLLKENDKAKDDWDENEDDDEWDDDDEWEDEDGKEEK